VSENADSIEHNGYCIRVLNWNGRYKAWISRLHSPKVVSGFTAATEISTDWCDTHADAVLAAKAAIDAGEVR